MDVIGRYEESPFLRTRLAHLDTLDQGRRKHHVPLLLEVDVTEARAQMRDLKARTGGAPSFTGWIVACLAHAISEHPRVHAMRRGTSSLVAFHDVTDGAPVARFVARLRELLQSGFGLCDREVATASGGDTPRGPPRLDARPAVNGHALSGPDAPNAVRH